MMTTKLFPIVALSALFTAACIDTGEDVGSVFGAIDCASDADCPVGLECEHEHGDSYCKPHGGDDGQGAGSSTSSSSASGTGGSTGGACQVDADCPAGEECEHEHGDSYCKPHGGDDGQGGDGGGGINECQDDLDCPAGEECEHEHGDSFCQPHGGN